MSEQLTVNGILRICCADKSNLEAPIEVGDGSVARKCTKCGRNHYTMRAEPGVFGIKGFDPALLTNEQINEFLEKIVNKNVPVEINGALGKVLKKALIKEKR